MISPLNNLPIGCSQFLLEKLDTKSLIALRTTNKKYKKEVDKHVNHVFPENETELMKLKIGIVKIESRIQELQKTRKILTEKNSELYGITLQGFWGKFATFVISFKKSAALITKLFCKIFPRVDRLLKERETIEVANSRLHLPTSEANREKFKLEESYLSKLIKYRREMKLKRAHEKIMELVGGLDGYNKLPILDIKERQGRTGYLDFINPSDLTSTIMKGVDKHHRPFIAMRFKLNGDDKVMILFQRYSDEPTWVDAGTSLTTLEGWIGGSLINENGLYTQEAFERLRKQINHIREGNGHFIRKPHPAGIEPAEPTE